MGSDCSETELLARCRRGESDAWDALFDQHYSATARFVFQLGYDLRRPEIEELCQEIFLTVIEKVETFQGQCQFQTWLFRIASNKARDYWQRQRAQKRGGGVAPLSLDAEDPETGLALDPPSRAQAPDRCLIQSEACEAVDQALRMLGGPCQEIIQLRYFADLSYEEIAGALKLNPKTVSSRLSKCLDRLQAVYLKISGREKTEPFSV